jgi:thiol-disulfide isomerase/thioredoxin
MSKIIDFIYGKFIKPYSFTILVIFLIIIFIIFGYYGYKWYYENKQKNKIFKNVANANINGEPLEIVLFSANWCPKCQNIKPEWKSFIEEYNGQTINGFLIKCRDVDCSDNTDPSVVNVINEYKIEGYPTVKMFVQNKEIDFDAKISKSSLEQFVYSVTNN